MKKKIVVFHPALAPYRVDFFNAINTEFDAAFYFNLPNVADQKFDQETLAKKCNFKLNFIQNGFEFFGRSFRFGIIGILQKEKPDIILCSEYGPVTLIVVLYKIFSRKKNSLYTISDDSLKNSIDRKGFRAFLRYVISKKCTGIIFTSNEVCNWFKMNISNKIKLLELPIIHSDEVFRAELALSLEVANKNISNYNLKEKKVILFVGRLTEVKNLPFLIHAVVSLKSSDWILVVVGDGTLKEELKKQTLSLNISDKIHFVGRKEGLELISWYTLAHIFVLPSVYEPFGAVVNEALLGGCKVLCSEVAGASSLINANNGALFSPYNKNELVNFLEDSLDEIDCSTISHISKTRESKMPFTFKEKIEVLIKNLY